MSDSVAAVAFTPPTWNRPPDLDRPSDLVERAPIQRLPARPAVRPPTLA
ncbi:hypothetical protein [Streptomyces hydrogenans]|nr:hypothetical protein [Streptomyces hydrogenans]GHF93000.1 hypothetical protein GCM10018784_00370 [Streptomyces hydrogenans]